MPRVFASTAALVAVLAASAAVAHEGHGATPAHLHPAGGFPVDIGAIVIVGVVGAVALMLAVARRRR